MLLGYRLKQKLTMKRKMKNVNSKKVQDIMDRFEKLTDEEKITFLDKFFDVQEDGSDQEQLVAYTGLREDPSDKEKIIKVK